MDGRSTPLLVSVLRRLAEGSDDKLRILAMDVTHPASIHAAATQLDGQAIRPDGYGWDERHLRPARKHKPDETCHRDARPEQSGKFLITPVANIPGSLHTVRSE